MRLIEMQPSSGERLFVNPSFITAVWPSEKDGSTVNVSISELPGSPQIQKQVKGPLEDLVARINAALHAP
jgi:hypothetical protein